MAVFDRVCLPDSLPVFSLERGWGWDYRPGLGLIALQRKRILCELHHLLPDQSSNLFLASSPVDVLDYGNRSMKGTRNNVWIQNTGAPVL